MKIQLQQYLDFLSLNPQDYATTLDYRCDVVSILHGIDVEDVEDLSLDDLIKLERAIPNELPTKHTQGSVRSMTFGQFIDVEHYISDIQNLPKILSILYDNNDWGFKDNDWGACLLSDVWAVYSDYLKFRDELIKGYPNIFTPPASEDDEEEYDEPVKNTGWQGVVFNLCNGDLTKFHEVTSLKLILVLNYLSWNKG
jgi:hypothetical protein